MTLLRRVVLPLRLLLLATFGLLVLLQVMSFPGQFAHMAEQDPEAAFLRWPLTAFAALELLCVEVVVVCTWQLLSKVEQDEIFTGRSLVWVDAIVVAIGAGWLMLAGLAGWFMLALADDPGTPLLLCVVLVVGAVLGLLVLVLRALLEQAIALRTDMEAVI